MTEDEFKALNFIDELRQTYKEQMGDDTAPEDFTDMSDGLDDLDDIDDLGDGLDDGLGGFDDSMF